MRAKFTQRTGWIATVTLCGIALSGCESSRFTGRGPVTGARATTTDPGFDAVTPAVPSGSVTSQPLGPLTGSGSVPTMPGGPQPVETLGSAPPQIATAPTGGTSRSASVGAWTAREASGASCRVTLSSTPSLDLYRAAAGGCANKDLSRVTAWDFRDGEVFLFQPGGAVAARLRAQDGSLSGVLSKSGAPITMSKG